MSNYEEWNGYLVRKGPTPRTCGFILPKDRPQFNKHNKKIKQENNAVSKKEVEPIEVIRNLLTQITTDFTSSEKMYFIQDKLKVHNFEALKTKTRGELDEYIKLLKGCRNEK